MARDYRVRERVVHTDPDDVTVRQDVVAGPVVERHTQVERPAYVERQVVEPAAAYVEKWNSLFR